MADETVNETASSGYGDYTRYCADHGDAPDTATFAQYNRIASCMADFLCGRALDTSSATVREAVHWQIFFMRGKGSVAACFSDTPQKESFGSYTVERRQEGNKNRLFGMRDHDLDARMRVSATFCALDAYVGAAGDPFSDGESGYSYRIRAMGTPVRMYVMPDGAAWEMKFTYEEYKI